MITLLAPEQEADFGAACCHEPVSGAKIATLLRVYGYHSPIAPIWLCRDSTGKTVAALSRFEGRLDVSASADADFDEIAAFAAVIGEFFCVEASAETCAYLQRHLPGELESFLKMRYTGEYFIADFGAVYGTPSLREVYDLICASNSLLGRLPLWESWYTHVSYLVRHSLGFCCTVHHNGTPVCTGGVYTMGMHAAVISSLFTLPAYRRGGYAALAVKHLVNRILAIGKEPILCCGSDTLADYYARLGFEACGRRGKLTLHQ